MEASRFDNLFLAFLAFVSLIGEPFASKLALLVRRPRQERRDRRPPVKVAAASLQRIAQIQKAELAKIPVMSVQRCYTMLPEYGG